MCMWWISTILFHCTLTYPLLHNEQGGNCIRKLKRNMFKETGSNVVHVFWRPIQLIWNFLYLSWWFGRLVEEKKIIRLLLLKHLLFPKFVPRAATEFHSGLSSFLYHWSIFSIGRLPLDAGKICLSIDVQCTCDGQFRNIFKNHSRVYGEILLSSALWRWAWEAVLRIRIRDPVQSRSGSGMNIPDHISVSLETIFGFKILKLFDVDPNPGSGIFLTRDPGWKN